MEHIKDNRDFAQARVKITVLAEGIKDTRNIYVHLEKENEDWKIGSYFSEDHSALDPITKIYKGHILQNEIREFNSE